ncbi:hypothetical protein HPB48_009075 [Haemaphysalis longicornis]|uniref:HTH CENPB-type domain-containing protein n=1 Tax=Haemaphysalis longicornis TaxID=44386 RepID=A0A9J6FYV2_HAELO|nr:hypothetical protein HPB48_009075 [Haemaphysalis longicornis]
MNMPVSGSLLQRKARDFACIMGYDSFVASSGWLQRFKERHDIVGRAVCGESQSVDEAEATSLKRDTDVDLYAAIEMLQAAWMSVTATTIANCFRHASFAALPNASNEPLDEPAVPDSFTASGEVSASWTALRNAGVVPDSESFCDYVSADSEVVATEQLTDDDIVCAVNEPDETSDDESEARDLGSKASRMQNPRRKNGKLETHCQGRARRSALLRAVRGVLPPPRITQLVISPFEWPQKQGKKTALEEAREQRRQQPNTPRISGDEEKGVPAPTPQAMQRADVTCPNASRIPSLSPATASNEEASHTLPQRPTPRERPSLSRATPSSHRQAPAAAEPTQRAAKPHTPPPPPRA